LVKPGYTKNIEYPYPYTGYAEFCVPLFFRKTAWKFGSFELPEWSYFWKEFPFPGDIPEFILSLSISDFISGINGIIGIYRHDLGRVKFNLPVVPVVKIYNG